MIDYSYIYKTKFRKMGKWNLLPADSNGNWHSEETSRYFKKIFGFGKGTFIIQTLTDDMQHAYFPQFYIDHIYNYISKTNQRDYKKLQRILKGFYKLRQQARKVIPKTGSIDLKKVSRNELIKVFQYNRDWAHRVTPYDQFGWITEDYWNPIMEECLINYGLQKDSEEYLRVLFVLTKPEEVSTTLMEKRSLLEMAINIKRKTIDLVSASIYLAKEYGWMPVFTYGTPWNKRHYLKELKQEIGNDLSDLMFEYLKLKNYTKIRNLELRKVVQKYKFKTRDLQKFIDFSLVLDARNEAEYLVSLCGFYVLPIYDEIAKRLKISVKQLRNLTVRNIIACLQGKLNVRKTLTKQGKVMGWVFDKSMLNIKYLNSKEARKFFDYLNNSATNLQGNDEYTGLCASPGMAFGRVKVVLYPNEGDKVKKGDILVAHATTVDYLPAMKLAAAFVTEVGGLTCHAAVVAREFNVPCVVGLKNATKNFKDGSFVEVDANKGTIKALTRK